MRCLSIPLLSLFVALSGCHLHANADEVRIKNQKQIESSISLEKQVNNLRGEEIEMKKVIESYVRGADEQNTQLVDNAFHNSFQVFVNSNGSVRVIDKATYIKLLETGKIGGSKRQIAG